MATLRLVNNTTSPIALADVGITLPAQSPHDFSEAAMLRDLGASSSLRTAMATGDVTARNSADLTLTADDLKLYWYTAGQGALTACVVQSADGSLWRVTVSDIGLITATKIV